MNIGKTVEWWSDNYIGYGTDIFKGNKMVAVILGDTEEESKKRAEAFVNLVDENFSA